MAVHLGIDTRDKYWETEVHNELSEKTIKFKKGKEPMLETVQLYYSKIPFSIQLKV